MRTDFHRWLVWLTDGQLAAAQRAACEAGMAVGIVHDLAVGVHPGGSDAFESALHARRISVGAPPDAFNARGQDWGLPPWRPDVLAGTGYAAFRSLLRGVFRYAGALRIDHVMGLFRLWWIPEGTPPAEGTYVGYDGEAMLAVLVLEAHRAGAPVIGEDLGTVEPHVRRELARRGVLGTSVLWFERDWAGDGSPLAAQAWRADCLATVTTHDLPPTAAKLSGGHVELRDRLGLLTRPVERERAEDAADTAEWLALLDGLGLDTKGEEAAVQALYAFLLRTPARLVGVWLPDAVGDRRPQNLPGTWDQYPNWRLPVADASGRPLALEELMASPRANALLNAVREERVPVRHPRARAAFRCSLRLHRGQEERSARRRRLGRNDADDAADDVSRSRADPRRRRRPGPGPEHRRDARPVRGPADRDLPGHRGPRDGPRQVGQAEEEAGLTRSGPLGAGAV